MYVEIFENWSFRNSRITRPIELEFGVDLK